MKIEFNLDKQIRIDKFLSEKIDSISREKIKNLIKNGNVLVNNKKVLKPNFVLSLNDLILVNIEKETNNDKLFVWKDSKMPEIIFECNDYLIINKPSGLVVHPGNGNENNTLVNILLGNNIKLSKKTSPRPGIVHRIDKNTSGILLIAKNDKFHDYILNEFLLGNVEKTYELITDGKYETKKGIIDVPIGRDQNNRKIMKATLENSKNAKSIFKIKKSFKDNEYVEFKILTGRTHQIRVHSKFINAPVLNDPEYGKKVFDKEFGQYLHAKKISFKDLDGKKVEYECDLPEKFLQKLKELTNNI